MEVIGVGFGRTGTNSLKLALDELGYRSFHTKEMLLHPRIFLDWYDRVFSKPTVSLGQPDLTAIVQAGFTATTDFPVAFYCAELLELYPHAKFVLTTHESPEAWFRSFRKLVENMEIILRYAPWLPVMPNIERYTRWVIGLLHQRDASFLTCSSPIVMDATRAMESYRNHIDQVRKVIPADQLLEFDMSQGWDPLCEFLGKPVPRHAFPRTNSSAEVTRLCWIVVVASNGMLLLVLCKLSRWILSRGRRK